MKWYSYAQNDNDPNRIPATFQQPKLNATAAGPGNADTQATASLLSARLEPSSPALPLTLGFVGAVPITWLQRRVRLRLAGRHPREPKGADSKAPGGVRDSRARRRAG